MFAALVEGRSGVSELRHPAGRANVTRGYHVAHGRPGDSFRASGLLARCVSDAVAAAGVDLGAGRVAAVVGTGLGELSTVEEAIDEESLPDPERLHFAEAVRTAVPGIGDVLTLANACSAGGHALAVAQDMVELGDADAVVVAGVDVMTTSMLAMIGRVAEEPTSQVCPFDADRTGVLLGEGAAAVVLVPDEPAAAGFPRLLATGLSCDAHHETAPSVDGIARAMRDALARAGRRPEDVDLVVAHGTGTALNDPAEAAATGAVLGQPCRALVTAAKGAVGHTSGAAALFNLDIALRAMATGIVPPVVGLGRVLPEGDGLQFVRERAVAADVRLAQVHAFGFGGVNAVTLVEAP